MVRLISVLGSAIVVKHKIDEQALTAKILDIPRQYLDLQRLRLAVRKALGAGPCRGDGSETVSAPAGFRLGEFSLALRLRGGFVQTGFAQESSSFDSWGSALAISCNRLASSARRFSRISKTVFKTRRPSRVLTCVERHRFMTRPFPPCDAGGSAIASQSPAPTGRALADDRAQRHPEINAIPASVAAISEEITE